jgi:hypothetical protein
VIAAAKALLEASTAVPVQHAERQEASPPPPQVLTPVRGVPIVNSAAVSGVVPTAMAALAAPAEAASAGDGGVDALLRAIRDEVERSTLSAHTKELLLLHLLHSWSVLRMLGGMSAEQQ